MRINYIVNNFCSCLIWKKVWYIEISGVLLKRNYAYIIKAYIIRAVLLERIKQHKLSHDRSRYMDRI
jgi:hypothetical protein